MQRQDNIIPFEKPQRRLWQFSTPHELARDETMPIEQKRAILATWASDMHAVESLPVLRHLPGTPFPVTFGAIMNAMAELDRQAQSDDDDPPPPKAQRARSAQRSAA